MNPTPSSSARLNAYRGMGRQFVRQLTDSLAHIATVY